MPIASTVTCAIQESLITLLCYHTRGDEVHRQVPVGVYESYYRKIADKVYDYWFQYAKPPGDHTLDIIDELCVAKPDDDEIYRRIYHSLLAGKDDINSEYIIGKAADFVQTQRFKQAIVESVPLLQNGDLDGVKELLADAMSGKADAAIDFKPMTFAELASADVSVEYLIEGVLAAKQPMLLAGPVKSLKTSILLDLCLSLATGRYFLGHFNVVKKIPVAILTGESGLPVIKDTLNRIARARRIDPAKVKRLIISDTVPQLANRRHLDALRRLIEEYDLELLAIDPAYLALDGTDANNLMIFGQQLRAVSRMCQELGVALLICHHTKKASGADHKPLELTDAAWAGFAEHARQWILVNHREKYDPETGVHRLHLAVGGSAGHSGLWSVDVDQGHLAEGRYWKVTVATPSVAKAKGTEDRLIADKEKIIDAMTRLEQDHPEGNAKTVIRDACPVRDEAFKSALQALLDDEHVVECNIQRSNRTVHGFKLAESRARCRLD